MYFKIEKKHIILYIFCFDIVLQLKKNLKYKTTDLPDPQNKDPLN